MGFGIRRINLDYALEAYTGAPKLTFLKQIECCQKELFIRLALRSSESGCFLANCVNSWIPRRGRRNLRNDDRSCICLRYSVHES